MASIADALSPSHRGFTLEEATSLGHPGFDEPVPKYEPLADDVGRSAQSEPHGPVANGHVSPPPLTERDPRRAARRSTSPPCLPPGAAPAAIRAWDDRTGQGEDGAHSDRPASSSADVPSQRITSSSERDGEEEDGLAYDRDSPSLGEEGVAGGDGKHHEEDSSFLESGEEASVDATTTFISSTVSTGAVSNVGGTTSLSRAGTQWRIPRVPPPSVDPDTIDIPQPAAHELHSLYTAGTGAQEDEDEIRTDETTDERAHSAAAAREVSRAMDALAFSASGYVTPKAPPPGYGLALPAQSQAAGPYPRSSSPSQPSSLGRTPQSSVPPSPILPPNPPFANRSRASLISEARPGHVSSESAPGRIPTPTPTITTSIVGSGGASSPLGPRPTSPMYRSPPPEYPRPTPPFSSPLMASSTSSLNSGGGGASLGSGPRTISAAAFRRQQMRSPSGTESGPADTSPLTLRKPSVSPSPSASRQPHMGLGSGSTSPVPVPVSKDLPRARLSVVNPDPRVEDEEAEGREEFDYIEAYGESTGYSAGRYVSDLERH
jgi:hypothetical protein